MAQQGGKGTQSSQSDKNYWARLKVSGGVSKAKARKIAAAAKRKQGVIDYGRKPAEPALPRVVFSGQPQENFPKMDWIKRCYVLKHDSVVQRDTETEKNSLLRMI